MSKISRSVYQKVKEENKRLLNDIKLLVQETPSADKILCIIKWRELFEKEREFNEAIKTLLTQNDFSNS